MAIAWPSLFMLSEPHGASSLLRRQLASHYPTHGFFHLYLKDQRVLSFSPFSFSFSPTGSVPISGSDLAGKDPKPIAEAPPAVPQRHDLSRKRKRDGSPCHDRRSLLGTWGTAAICLSRHGGKSSTNLNIPHKLGASPCFSMASWADKQF